MGPGSDDMGQTWHSHRMPVRTVYATSTSTPAVATLPSAHSTSQTPGASTLGKGRAPDRPVSTSTPEHRHCRHHYHICRDRHLPEVHHTGPIWDGLK